MTAARPRRHTRRTRSLTLINAFEVPPEADEPFVAGWEGAREFLAAKGGFTTTALHRALRPDADFRFVNVARIDSPETWRRSLADPGFPGAAAPFTAHAGLYSVVHEDGAPEGTDGVTLIDAREVPADADEAFASAWSRARDELATHAGYLGTRLHRSLTDADFRFVTIARWSSPLAFSRAVQRSGLADGGGVPFPSHSALYQVVAA